MSSYGAYYYSSAKPEGKVEGRSSPPPTRYGDRPGTASRFQRRRSVTPPDGERRVPYYQEMERPKNPGSTDQKLHSSYLAERPVTAVPYISPRTAPPPQSASPTRPPERKRAESPDPSIVSDLSEPEIKPNYSTVDYYTYSKCLER